jgi:hypothetical protein
MKIEAEPLERIAIRVPRRNHDYSKTVACRPAMMLLRK